MKVAGFTFIKNAIIYDYPIVEAINSILPLCDEVYVALGKSDDETEALIKAIHPGKIKILKTLWDENLKQGGQVLAVETNKAFQAIPNFYDWCFYIQGDEAVHEKYLPIINQALLNYKSNKNVDGLLFKYLHFYGSYDYIGNSSGWYNNEIRIIKNNKKIYSYKDAQGFRKNNNEKLKVKPIDAYIYHYGWVKNPKAMQRKQEELNKLWHDDNWIEKNVLKVEEFDYAQIDSLMKFTDTHPNIMLKRIASKNWQFEFDLKHNKTKLKDKLKQVAYKLFGWEIGYKNYKKI
ncbi:MAG: glycosyltransferase family 2 protein [Bacteroidia bacterium]|nr:glycosyltransferase family 2 protein [Bacteroidia bacterium]